MQHDHEPEDHDRGLAFDLQTLTRRRALRLFGGVGLGVVGLIACDANSSGDAGDGGDGGDASATSGSTTGSAGGSAGGSASTSAGASTSAAASSSSASETTAGAAAIVTEEIPDETGGPFPGDGTNGVNVLTEEGIVRQDITASFGSSTTVADGIPLEVVLNVQDVANGGNPLAGAAVYIWHCDAAGAYSLYSQGVTDENYLRGVQEVGADGNVTFTTVFPGCYPGRWPHIHFEVYESVDAASSGRNAIKTSQLAFPQAPSEAVYADGRYPDSAGNLSRLSLATDGVFGDDGGVHQLAIVSGSNDAGYSAVLPVGV